MPGTLHAVLLDLYEASHAWTAAPPAFCGGGGLAARRAALLDAAAAALAHAKCVHLPRVADAAGVGAAYRAACLAGRGRPDRARAAATLAAAEFGLAAAVVDAQRDVGFAEALGGDAGRRADAVAAALRAAVADARGVVAHAVAGSAALWTRFDAAVAADAAATAAAGGRPYAAPRGPPPRRADPAAPLGGDDVVRLHQKAMARFADALETRVAAGVRGGAAALAAVLREGGVATPPSSPAPASPTKGAAGGGGFNFDDLVEGLVDVAVVDGGRTHARTEP